MNKRFYITTAIDYVNGQPHLGHAYEKVMADIIARVETALGREPFFLTGLDEHGQKVQKAAQQEGKDPQKYCDELLADWKRFAGTLKLTNDDFIRTTESRLKTVVQAILSKLHAASEPRHQFLTSPASRDQGSEADAEQSGHWRFRDL